MRLIDADALFEAFNKAAWFDNADRDDVALELVLDAPTITPPPNAPLTLEELREMDGEPVWVQSRDGDREGIWAFVDVGCELVRVFTTRYSVKFAGVFRHFKTYGKTWLAYRRKPEGGNGDA